MRENASLLSNAEFNEIISLPFEQAFDKILNDYRYTSRFNPDLEEFNGGRPKLEARTLVWVFMDKYFPWIYHTDLGWIYISGGTQDYDKVLDVGFWAFYENLGWAWTYNEVFLTFFWKTNGLA